MVTAHRIAIAAVVLPFVGLACAARTEHDPAADGESAFSVCEDDASSFPTEAESSAYASSTVVAPPAALDVGVMALAPRTLRPLAEPPACRKTTRDAARDCIWSALGLKYAPGSKAGQAVYTALACLSGDSGTDKAQCLQTLAELIGARAFPAWRIYIATVSCGIILPAHAAANTFEYYTTNPCEEKAPANDVDAQFSCMSVADSVETLCSDIKDKRNDLAKGTLQEKTDFCENECASIYNGCFNPITDPSNQRGRKFECWGSCVAYCKATLLQLKPNGDREDGAKELCRDRFSFKW